MGSSTTSSLSTATTAANGCGPNGVPVIDASSLAAEAVVGCAFGFEDGDLLLVLGADATAAGVDTFAALSLQASVSGNGQSRSVSASIEVLAIAASPDQQGSASAIAFADFYGNADFYVRIGQTMTSSSQDESGSVFVAASWVEIAAFELIDPMALGPSPGSPTGSGAGPAPPPPGAPAEGCGCAGDGEIVYDLDGNVAFFFVDAQAAGDDSFVEVDLAAFTVEDQLSAIASVVTLAVDG